MVYGMYILYLLLEYSLISKTVAKLITAVCLTQLKLASQENSESKHTEEGLKLKFRC